tara:strand:+ start:1973 stop:2257 length:285 start_codon:yes stop_codon:yes gene_type:complete
MDINYKSIDITITPPEKEILFEAILQLKERKFLLNRSGISYRQLGSKVIEKMDDAELIDNMIRDGKLIKRPFLISSTQKILVGFKQDDWYNLLR